MNFQGLYKILCVVKEENYHMKQRVSIMGSSEFEFNPNLLDERINNRELFFNQQLKNINNSIKNLINSK